MILLFTLKQDVRMGEVHCLGKTHGLRILSVSDFQDKELIRRIQEREMPPIDLIISCGDLEPEYISFLRDRVDAPLYYVKGNHDIRYTPENTMGCENIHGRVIREGTMNLMGLEGSGWYNGGPNQYTEAAMKQMIFWMGFKIWRRKPVHMVVTHASPRHVHDREDLCHRGFETYNRLIKRLAPDYFIHGHIHEAFDRFDERITRIGSTRVINTCGHIIFEV